MTTYLLLTTRDCHLCVHGRAVLDTLTAEGILTWQEVGVDSLRGQLLAETAPPLRPVLFDIEGRVVAYGRLSENRLRRQLRRASVTTRAS